MVFKNAVWHTLQASNAMLLVQVKISQPHLKCYQPEKS